jgi:hypothetical protein
LLAHRFQCFRPQDERRYLSFDFVFPFLNSFYRIIDFGDHGVLHGRIGDQLRDGLCGLYTFLGALNRSRSIGNSSTGNRRCFRTGFRNGFRRDSSNRFRFSCHARCSIAARSRVRSRSMFVTRYNNSTGVAGAAGGSIKRAASSDALISAWRFTPALCRNTP